MTDRKPDFWVIKSNGADMGYFERPGVWTRNKKTRARFSTEGEAIAVAYTGRVVPVYCTSKRAEPKMRERSSSWALARMKEGKRVRRASWMRDSALRLNIGTMQFVYDGGAVGHITDAYALAQDWELAE